MPRPLTRHLLAHHLAPRLRSVVVAGTLGLASLAGGDWLSPSAEAEVAQRDGYWATVDGYRGWFGSYHMGDIGVAWCVDHGLAAPDPDRRYRPADLTDQPAPVRRAMAWALGTHGTRPDRATAAALTLVLHDLSRQAYPSGPLQVERLRPEDLQGFEGAGSDGAGFEGAGSDGAGSEGAGFEGAGSEEAGFEGAGRLVLERARSMRADALAHAHLVGPLRLTAGVQGGVVRGGQPATLVARLTDASGGGVEGARLHARASGVTLAPSGGERTDLAGEQRFTFTAAPGANRLEVSGVAPNMALRSFAPSAGRAQRVARPELVPVEAVTVVQARSPRLTIHKVGDVPAYLTSGGARFALRPLGPDGSPNAPIAEVVTGADGRSPPVDLAPGRYQVVEAAPPPGYRAGGPWLVDLGSDDTVLEETVLEETVLEAPNSARRGAAEVSKVDAVSGRTVGGATLRLAYDADRDGSFETEVGAMASGHQPVTRSELLPGDYQLIETAAPTGYEAAAHPVSFSVFPGQTASVVVANRPLPRVPPTRPVAAAPGAGPIRSAAPPQSPAARLPATGQPLAQIAGAGSGLAAGGGLLVSLTACPVRRARRARRRAGALCRELSRPLG